MENALREGTLSASEHSPRVNRNTAPRLVTGGSAERASYTTGDTRGDVEMPHGTNYTTGDTLGDVELPFQGQIGGKPAAVFIARFPSWLGLHICLTCGIAHSATPDSRQRTRHVGSCWLFRVPAGARCLTHHLQSTIPRAAPTLFKQQRQQYVTKTLPRRHRRSLTLPSQAATPPRTRWQSRAVL
jgi:hypothetical protein